MLRYLSLRISGRCRPTGTGQAVGRAALSIATRLVSNPNLLAVAVRPVATASGGTGLKVATAKQRAMAAAATEQVKTARMQLGGRLAIKYHVTNNLSFAAIEATVEFETVTFDYGLILAPGATITSATVTRSVVSGMDARPSARVVGSNTTSLQTGAANAAVSQLLGGIVGTFAVRRGSLFVKGRSTGSEGPRPPFFPSACLGACTLGSRLPRNNWRVPGGRMRVEHRASRAIVAKSVTGSDASGKDPTRASANPDTTGGASD